MKFRYIIYNLVIIFAIGLSISLTIFRAPITKQYISDMTECKENGVDHGEMLETCIELLELERNLKQFNDDLHEFNVEHTPGIDI